MADQAHDTPVLDLLAGMTADSVEASNLDAETLLQVRMNLGVARDLDIGADQVEGVLAAVAPIVGTARVVAAAGKIMQAIGVAIEIAELEAEADQE